MSSTLNVSVKPCDEATLGARRKDVDMIENMTKAQLQWYDCDSVADYRRFRREGSHGFPKPVLNPAAINFTIPSSHGEHSIPLRKILPSGNTSVKGVYLHFHGGGFVIGSSAAHDSLLSKLATDLSLTVVSVEYRKAPESIFPSMVEDCVDAALYALSDEGRQKLGGPLTVMSGESAGAYLTVLTAIKLRDNGVDVRAQIKALAPCYGIFDLTYLPSLRAHQRRALLGQEDTYRFIDTAFPPSVFPPEKRKSGDVSPLYAQLEGLPPALFLVGTADPLLDDSVFMASRWTLAGNEAKLVIVPEAVHGFTLMPTEVAEEGIRDVVEFLKEHI